MEVWGWNEERMHERYGRWVLGLDWETPEYIVREELKWKKLRLRGVKKAWKFEKRLKEGKESKWVKRCLKEIEKRNETGEGKSRWEKEKDTYV